MSAGKAYSNGQSKKGVETCRVQYFEALGQVRPGLGVCSGARPAGGSHVKRLTRLPREQGRHA